MGPYVIATGVACTSHAIHFISLTDDERVTLLEESLIAIPLTFNYVALLATYPTAELVKFIPVLMSTS